MSQYRYRAAGPDGGSVEGVIAAADTAAVTAALRTQGLFALAIDPVSLSAEVRPAPRRELAIVFRSLASLTAAGVPLEKAIAATAPLASARLAPELERWRASLYEGNSFSAALARPIGLIPPVVVGVLRAGERGSQLDLALEQTALQLELEAELRSRISQALAYPMLVASAGVISVLVITTLVLPKFAGLLSDLGQQLPPATRLLIGISHFVQADGVAGLIVLTALMVAFVAWVRTPTGAEWWSARLIELPLIGPLRLTLASARFNRALGAMLRTGLPMLPTLDAAGSAIGDPAVALRVSKARERVAGGESLCSALQREHACAASVLPVLAVGESSGQLALMATRAGNLAAQDAERRLSTLVSLLEPALIVVFGGMVAFVAAALLQAVYALRPS